MKELKKGEKGFSLIELVIVIALAGLITAAITTTIFQVFNMNTRTANRMTAVSQVQHAGKLVSQDILQAKDVTPGDALGFPLTLTWDEWASNYTREHHVTYNLTGNELWRHESIEGEEGEIVTRVAEYIDLDLTSVDPNEPCYYPNCGSFIFTVTATVGSESETRTYEVQPRPGS